MKIRTVADLRRYLESSHTTPEELARHVDISNMTIRRLLKRPGTTLLPQKYALLLNHSVSPVDAGLWPATSETNVDGFEQIVDELARDGSRVNDVDELAQKAKAKLGDKAIGEGLRQKVRSVLRAVTDKELDIRHRAICLGAILYFINPFDLIPDAIPGVGYLDDFAVLAIAIAALAKLPSRERGE